MNNRNLIIDHFNDKDDIKNKLRSDKNIKEINSFSIDFKCIFDFVQISIMKSSDVLAISNGEITKTDTLNYRSLKAEDHGIFCYRIFGGDKELECTCGRYSGIAHKSHRCERCGVVIGPKVMRRFNFGHITLHTSVAHPWFYTHICMLLNMTKRIFLSIVNYDSYIFVEDTYDGKYKAGNIVKAIDYYTDLSSYDVLVGGSEAIYELLSRIDLQQEYENISKSIHHKKIIEIAEKDIRRRDFIKSLVDNKVSTTDFIIKVIPVIPAALRPITYLEGGGVATMDINEQYRKIVSRKTRLQKLIDLETHIVITNNEKYMINQAVCQLIGPHKNKNTKSIAEYIKGKKGYFRRALLGKRTDFSGRSAIVCGPELPIDTCSLPVYIAMDIFKPFIYSVLIKRKIAYNILDAKKIVENKQPIAYSILHEVVQDYPIILNRAPTLHRLGIQAFKIKITNTNAIRIPPLVCTPYNADFDGDQMSCHLPISIPARTECYNLVLSNHNMFLPGSGKIAIMPSKDITVGLYYLTLESEFIYDHKIFNMQDAYMLYNNDYINENTVINIKIKDCQGSRYVKTTYGRIMIWDKIANDKLDFDVFNVVNNKANINNYITYVFKTLGQYATLGFLNEITKLGFYYFKQSGISYCPDDLIQISTSKYKEDLDENLKVLHSYYMDGNITAEEYNNNYINEWSNYIDQTSEQILKDLQNDNNSHDDLNGINQNNIYMMYISGARGSKSQIHQVLCLRGLISKPSGEISRFVIRSSLASGLNIFEYFESTHGERKCLSDVAIKTSRAGHFTRRLVDVAHRVFVCKEKCYTNEYMTINKFKDRRIHGINIEDAVYGHVLFDDAIDSNQNVLITKDTLITQNEIDIILNNDIHEIKIYSPVYCDLDNGVCQRCYGIDLSSHAIVDMGTLVGIIAAQSIGEPGTQLTMRTTHTGGIAQADSNEETIISSYQSVINLDELQYGVNSDNTKIVLVDSKIKFLSKSGIVVEEVMLKSGSVIIKNHLDQLEEGEMVAYYDKNIKTIIAISSGKIEYINIIENVTYRNEQDSDSYISRKRIISSQSISSVVPMIRVWLEGDKEKYNEYILETGMFVVCQNNTNIKAGDIVAKAFISANRVADITGGLPRVIDLFEVKKHINKCVIASTDGIVKIANRKNTKRSRSVNIVNESGDILSKYNIPVQKYLNVQDGMKITKGSIIVDGNIYLQDLLDAMGKDCMIKYLLGQISSIYEDQGVNINYKHFTVVIKQMIKYVVVKETVDDFLVGQVYEYHVINKENKKREIDGRPIVKYLHTVVGITKVAMNNSFISSSSFQHTISRLANAAINKSIDKLEGVKERVIFGKLIPAGTGYEEFNVEKIRGDISHITEKYRNKI